MDMNAKRRENRRRAARDANKAVETVRPQGWWFSWALGAVAVVLAAVAYANVSEDPFVYDDQLTVVGNPSIRDLGDLKFIVLYDVFRPAVNLSYAVDFARSGLNPRAYHFTNILLHLVNVALLFLLSLRMARDRLHKPGAAHLPDVAPLVIAVTAASLFAVHPMMTEAVTYVSGRSEVLCTVFFLAGFLLLYRFLTEGSGWRLVVGFGAFVCGLASKENAAMLPFVLLAAEWLVFSGTEADHKRRVWRWHLPFVGFITVAGLIRVVVFMRVEQGAEAVTMWQNALTEVGVVWRYLALLLVPVGQSIMHPVATVTGAADPGTVLACIGLVIVAALVFLLRRRLPLVCFGVVWFFLLLAPAHVIPLQEAMAEHRVYTASCGFFLAVGALFAVGLGVVERRGWSVVKTAAVVLAPVLLVFVTTTSARNKVWADPVLLWGDAAKKAPHTWGANYAYADALRAAGRCDEAVTWYRKAVSLIPGQLSAYLNQGICLAELGRFDEAYGVLQQARTLAPESPKVHNNLGTLAARMGRLEEARNHLHDAIRVDPANVQARLSLVKLAESVFDEPAEALRLCREIRDIDPRVPGIKECIERNEARLP